MYSQLQQAGVQRRQAAQRGGAAVQARARLAARAARRQRAARRRARRQRQRQRRGHSHTHRRRHASPAQHPPRRTRSVRAPDTATHSHNTKQTTPTQAIAREARRGLAGWRLAWDGSRCRRVCRHTPPTPGPQPLIAEDLDPARVKRDDRRESRPQSAAKATGGRSACILFSWKKFRGKPPEKVTTDRSN